MFLAEVFQMGTSFVQLYDLISMRIHLCGKNLPKKKKKREKFFVNNILLMHWVNTEKAVWKEWYSKTIKCNLKQCKYFCVPVLRLIWTLLKYLNRAGEKHYTSVSVHTLCSSIWNKTVSKIRLGREAAVRVCSACVSQLMKSWSELWNSIAKLRASSSLVCKERSYLNSIWYCAGYSAE